MCKCLWNLLSLKPDIFWDVGYLDYGYSVKMVVQINQEEGELLNLTVISPTFSSIFESYVSRVNVTWYHTYVEVFDPNNLKYITRIISKQFVQCHSPNCSITLALGKARVSDSGEYFVTVYGGIEYDTDLTEDDKYKRYSITGFNKKLIANTTYTVRVYSKNFPQLRVSVRDAVTNEIIYGYHLEYNLVYRFTCSSLWYPHPDLKMGWISLCNDSDTDSNPPTNVTLSQITGTFERVLYFESKPFNAGLLWCTDGRVKDELNLVVTDIPKQLYKKNKGVRLDVLPQTTDDFPKKPGILGIYRNNATLLLWLHKIVGRFRCVFEPSDEDDVVYRKAEQTSSENVLLVDATLKNFPSACSEFVPGWTLNYSDPAVEISLRDVSLYSTKFAIHINNVSSIASHGKIECYSIRDNGRQGDWDWVNVKILNFAGFPDIHNQFQPTKTFYKYNDVVQFNCDTYGSIVAYGYWTHNNAFVNESLYENGYNITGHNCTTDDKSTFDKCIAYSTSTIRVKIEELTDFGQYCCILWNGMKRNVSCVSIYYFPTDYLSLENLQIVVYSTLSFLTILFMVFTPVTFVRRLFQKVSFKSFLLFGLVCNFGQF